MTPNTLYTLAIGHSVAGIPHWSPETVEATVAVHWDRAGLPGFTLQAARGRWEGRAEDSTLLSYVGTEEDAPAVHEAAAAIAADLQQEAILLTAEPVHMAFIGATAAQQEVA